ncbi:MAG: hypothetical protein PF484_13190 [Bacteroidales bacterium]|nr:hypothetical protein [Bacteroidales bacterium]
MPTWKASITIGRNTGYTDIQISVDSIIEAISEIQKEIANTKNIKLSVKLTECIIVLVGQNEPSVTIDFIQYPKFPYSESELKESITLFAKRLMDVLSQNRIVVVFPDETIMLEQNDGIYPRIKF